ncbi:serine/threonine-protein kinase [Niveispirillum sp.]|uniref:serine/threonine-protein kinase n=1 Tax=Niveispirillum sp. TaxID=1917217 RepID=UPI001B4C182A|nr:serine/threonine-protein kinase [Niveispirillum sp.]MBP7335877.1 serine/threonine protein kinase [Niveispirillum sp.]
MSNKSIVDSLPLSSIRTSQPAAQRLPVGHVLAGRYRITGYLGHGGFGQTYRAWDLKLERDVAIKEIFPLDQVYRAADGSVRPQSPDNASVLVRARTKARDEAKRLAALEHNGIPNTARIHDILEDQNNTDYIVMEFIDGDTLDVWAKKQETRLDADTVLDVLRQLVEALDALHARGIIHADVKPQNVIINAKTKKPVLIDFGTARHVSMRVSRHVKSAGYTAPEISSLPNLNVALDVYSLGATLYHLMTRDDPAFGTEVSKRLNRLTAWPLALRRGVAMAMSLEPSQRPATVRALLAICSGVTDVATPGVRPEPANRDTAGKPTPVVARPGPAEWVTASSLSAFGTLVLLARAQFLPPDWSGPALTLAPMLLAPALPGLFRRHPLAVPALAAAALTNHTGSWTLLLPDGMAGAVAALLMMLWWLLFLQPNRWRDTPWSVWGVSLAGVTAAGLSWAGAGLAEAGGVLTAACFMLAGVALPGSGRQRAQAVPS